MGPPPGLVCLTLLRPSSTTSPPNTGAQLTKTALDLSTTTNSDTLLPVSPLSMLVLFLLVSMVIAMVFSTLVNVPHGKNSSKAICLNGDGIQLLINKQL